MALSRAKRFAISRPIPAEAPVTIATLSFRFIRVVFDETAYRPAFHSCNRFGRAESIATACYCIAAWHNLRPRST